METITAKYITAYIANNEIPFMATQSKLCIPIIDRLCRKMSHGIKFNDIKTCDNLIIDGHHRYLSSLIVGFNIGKVLSQKTSGTKSIEWRMVEFDENDWDTPGEISLLNERDAIYNGIDVEIIKQITLGSKK